MSSGLGEFHHTEEAPTRSSRITQWTIIVLIVGGIAAYVVSSGMLSPEPSTNTTQSFPRGI